MRRPAVILLGDSIRMSYQPFVRLELGETFDVSGPAENCATSRDLLANLDRWALDRPAAIVHLNAAFTTFATTPAATRRWCRSTNTSRMSAPF